MRLSDFLKGNKLPEKAESDVSSPVFSKLPESEKSAPPPVVQHHSSFLEAELAAVSAYGTAIALVRNLFKHLKQKGTPLPDFPKILTHASSFTDLLLAQNQHLLSLSDRATPDHYIYGHSVNVAIVAGATTMTLRWPREGVETMIWMGLVHDVGMIPWLEEPNAEETPVHLERTKEFLSLIPGLEASALESALTIITQMHEREDGTGYPYKLRGDDIHPYAKILGLADVYESLTHPRPHRGRLIPHAAVKSLLKGHHGSFDSNALKALIDTLSLFPPGSYVRLNNESIAKVIQIHPAAPTRPLVQIVIDEKGIWPEEQTFANLMERPMIHVTEALDELALTALPEQHKQELISNRWWTK